MATAEPAIAGKTVYSARRVFMGSFRNIFPALFFALCAFAPLSAQQTSYTVTDLSALSNTQFANAAGINDAGQIVGKLANHAFLWGKGAITDLGTLGGDLSAANAINDRGQIVGESSTASGEMHAFLWEHGVMTDLGAPGETSSAYGINNQGEIVGVAFGKNLRGGAVLWKNGQRQPLGDLGSSGSGSTAIAINDKGGIVGVSSGFASNSGGVVRAVIWENGVIRDIGTLGGLHSTANALNNGGEVVGWAEVGDQSTDAFIWKGAALVDLGRLPGGAIIPGSGSQAIAVNEQGQVVGSSLNSNAETRAVIWQDGNITDLNDLIPRALGLVLTRATAINSRGQILAEQQHGPDGPARSFLLTPRQRSH
jgi:probable HAF family extracellular repeat protein